MYKGLRKKLCYAASILAFCGFHSAASGAFEGKPDFADYRQQGEIVQKYSRSRENNTYGIMLRMHENVIRVLADGRVARSGHLRGYGRYVIIDHGEGWHSLYSHLSRVDAPRGKEIRRGTAIGTARHKRLFLVVSYRGNPINPSEVF